MPAGPDCAIRPANLPKNLIRVHLRSSAAKNTLAFRRQPGRASHTTSAPAPPGTRAPAIRPRQGRPDARLNRAVQTIPASIP